MGLFRNPSIHPRRLQIAYVAMDLSGGISDYDQLRPSEAKKHFDWFLGIMDERVKYFESEYIKHNPHNQIAYDSTGIERIWLWLNQIVGTKEISPEVLLLDRNSQWLCMDAGLFVGRCLISECPVMHWHLDANKKSIYFNRPTISLNLSNDATVDPCDIVQHSLTRYIGGDKEHTLMFRYNYYRQDWPNRDKPRYPPDIDEWVGEVTPPDEEYDRWQIYIDSGAEDYLGETVFAGLEKYLSGIDGVEDLAWEDREIFSFSTTRADLAELRRDFFKRFAIAAKDAHDQGYAK